MRFEFTSATRIIFGYGTVSEVAEEAALLGKRPLTVIGCPDQQAGPFFDRLTKYGLAAVRFEISGEPTVSSVTEGTAAARSEQCDMVIALGGGSAIDAGKAIAALLSNEGELYDYLEVVGRGRRLVNPAAPMIAVPTTSGTGAEVTKNAVITSSEQRVKASLRSPLIQPRLAVVDPALTHTLPPGITAATGLDALTQCIEAYVCVKANPAADALCREGIIRAARSLRIACDNSDDAAAREDMSLASLFSGLALANAALGAVHGLAAAIGGRCSAPHGVVCALLLAPVMKANVKALQERGDDSPALGRYAQIAAMVTGNTAASAVDGIAWITRLCAELPLPCPTSLGLNRKDFACVAADARKASSMKGNPIELTQEELIAVLEERFG